MIGLVFVVTILNSFEGKSRTNTIARKERNGCNSTLDCIPNRRIMVESDTVIDRLLDRNAILEF